MLNLIIFWIINKKTKVAKVKLDEIDHQILDILKANRVISQATKKVKIFGICEISQPMTVTGILVTKGAKESIEKAGGTVASIEVKPVKEKFVKTSKKTDTKTPTNAEESSD